MNIATLQELLAKFSRLVIEQRWIKEIDINPLLASPDRLIPLMQSGGERQGHESGDLPRLAIRPYPSRYQRPVALEDGTHHGASHSPGRRPFVSEFHHTLSERSVYMRSFRWMRLEQRPGGYASSTTTGRWHSSGTS